MGALEGEGGTRRVGMGWKEGRKWTDLPHQSDDLSSSARLEVEVVDRGHAADFLVGGAGGADFRGCGHRKGSFGFEARRGG